jgi:Putative zinc-finger
VNPLSFCQKYHDALFQYSTGQLPAGERAILEAHLSICDTCRAELAMWQALGEQRREAVQVPLATPDETTFAAILTRLPSSLTQMKTTGAIPMNNSPLTYDFAHDFEDTPSLTETNPHPQQHRWMAIAASLLTTILLVGAFGFAGWYMHTRPEATTLKPLPANIGELTKVVMVSPTEGWAINPRKLPSECHTSTPSPGTALLHYQNGSWVEVQTPYSSKSCSSIEDIVMLSVDEGWAEGISLDPSQWERTFVLHYTHGVWQDAKVNYLVVNGGPFLTFNSKDIWIIGGISPLTEDVPYNTEFNGETLVLHYDGTTWTRITDPKLWHILGLGSWGTSTNDLTIYGADLNIRTCPDNLNCTFLHYDGHIWSEIQRPDMIFTNISFPNSTPGEGWATGCRGTEPNCTYFTHFHDGRWDTPVQVTVAQDFIRSIDMLSPTEGWALGTGQILHYSNGTWTVDWQQSAKVSAGHLYSIAMVSPTEGWAVGAATDKANAPALIMHYSHGQWSVYP